MTTAKIAGISFLTNFNERRKIINFFSLICDNISKKIGGGGHVLMHGRVEIKFPENVHYIHF
jgi:hypothetical protein